MERPDTSGIILERSHHSHTRRVDVTGWNTHRFQLIGHTDVTYMPP
jgi:hypothetical protein